MKRLPKAGPQHWAIYVWMRECLLREVGQGEIEGRPFADFALCPGAPAVAADDASHIGQADASALKLLDVVQTLEHPEELVCLCHVEANAVIAHIYDGLAGRLLYGPDLDAGRMPIARELEGVRNQVAKDQPQHRPVAHGTWQRSNIPDDLAALDLRPEVPQDLVQQFPDIQLGLREIGAPDVGEEQQVVDELTHLAGTPLDQAEVVMALLVQRCAGAFL